MTIPAYPLQWPEGWKRTEPQRRAYARFSSRGGDRARYQQLSISEAVERVRKQLDTMGIHADDLVISSNLLLRLDGFPRSGQQEPSDPGVAVYWEAPNGDRRCMAIDRYDRTADNIAAIAATLDAMRAIERHGGAEILNRAFTGFVAIEDQSKPWHIVLGVQVHAPTEHVRDAYKRARAATHPDRGGNAELFQAVQDAWGVFCKERGLES